MSLPPSSHLKVLPDSNQIKKHPAGQCPTGCGVILSRLQHYSYRWLGVRGLRLFSSDDFLAVDDVYAAERLQLVIRSIHLDCLAVERVNIYLTVSVSIDVVYACCLADVVCECHSREGIA